MNLFPSWVYWDLGMVLLVIFLVCPIISIFRRGEWVTREEAKRRIDNAEH